MKSAKNTISVERRNQCWTVYADKDHEGKQLCFMGRPQDWGDPRWMWRTYVLHAPIDGVQWVNVVHIWHEGQIPDHQLVAECGGLLTMIMTPGFPPELSGKSYMHEDDFWEDSWGVMPAYFYENNDDDEP